MATHSCIPAGESHGQRKLLAPEDWWATVYGTAKSQTRLTVFLVFAAMHKIDN